jgi:hypothetical protein
MCLENLSKHHAWPASCDSWKNRLVREPDDHNNVNFITRQYLVISPKIGFAGGPTSSLAIWRNVTDSVSHHILTHHKSRDAFTMHHTSCMRTYGWPTGCWIKRSKGRRPLLIVYWGTTHGSELCSSSASTLIHNQSFPPKRRNIYITSRCRNRKDNTNSTGSSSLPT